MITRETTLNKFTNKINDLISSNYLLANSRVADLITIINNSKMLSEIFKYFAEGYDFENALSNTFKMENGEMILDMPETYEEILPLVFLLLREINFKKVMLADVLDFMNVGKNYESAFNIFCEKIIIPFKNACIVICNKMIESTPEFSHIEQTEKLENNNINNTQEYMVNQFNVVNLPIRIVKLLELDKLSVTQSRISQDEKEELLYVIDTFINIIQKGDKEKIKLGYLAYYYALKLYKKIQTNVKEISKVLVENNIL